MSAINIRMATDADHDKILELARRCPQEGMVSFFPLRTPRFNTLHRLIDPGAWHYVACKGDEIIGLVGVMHFQARVLDKVCKVGYMLDLRLDKEYRSGIAAFRLVKTAIDHLRNSDADMVIVNFLKDNKRPLVFTSGRGGLPVAHSLGDNMIFNILSFYKMKLNKRFEVSKPTKADIPEILELYKHYGASFKIAPVINEDLFNRYITTIDGLSLDNFLVARENGKIKAVTALWDEHNYKNYFVQKLNFSINVVTNILKFLSLFMRVPQPIRLHKPLTQLMIVLNAHDGCPEALETLFRHVNNIMRGSKYTLLTLYGQENDPMFKLIKKFKGFSVKSEMHLFSKDTSVFEQLDNDPSPVMFDLSLSQ